MTEEQRDISLGGLQAEVQSLHRAVVANLASARAARDEINQTIRILVQDEKLARRALNALTPKVKKNAHQ